MEQMATLATSALIIPCQPQVSGIPPLAQLDLECFAPLPGYYNGCARLRATTGSENEGIKSFTHVTF